MPRRFTYKKFQINLLPRLQAVEYLPKQNLAVILPYSNFGLYGK